MIWANQNKRNYKKHQNNVYECRWAKSRITLLYPESNSDIIRASSFSNVLKYNIMQIEWNVRKLVWSQKYWNRPDLYTDLYTLVFTRNFSAGISLLPFKIHRQNIPMWKNHFGRIWFSPRAICNVHIVRLQIKIYHLHNILLKLISLIFNVWFKKNENFLLLFAICSDELNTHWK